MGQHITIDDLNYRDHVADFDHDDGDKRMRGLIPRDLSVHPKGCFACAKPFDLPLIPASDWKDAWELQKARGATLSDIRARGNFGKMIPSRDQNGKGYCWAHSSTSAALLVRARENQPYADLSAYAVACVIKHFRDEGGFGGQSLEFIADRGIPTADFWPQKSMAKTNDNPKTWENAALHRFTEWMDLKSRDMRQVVTCLLLGIPVVVDYNWWSHSVCAIRIAELHPQDEAADIVIWNSWGDGWSEHGEGTLKGSKARPDDAVAPRVMTAAA